MRVRTLRTLRTSCLLSIAILALPNFAPAQISDASTQELIDRLKDSESDVERRRDAAYELVRRGEQSAEVVAGFAAALSERDNQIRFQALLGLARMGAAAEPAVPHLIEQLGDRDDQVRYRAADALAKIGAAALEPLITAWPDSSESAKIAIARAIAGIGPLAQPAQPVMSEALESQIGGLPRYAAEALAAITPEDETAVMKLVRHADVDVRLVGFTALAALPRPSPEAVQALRNGIADGGPKVREAAIIALAASELPIADKAELVEKCLVDEAESVRAAAIVAMRTAGLTDSEFATRIAVRLHELEGEAATSVVKALASIGPSARDTLPEVLKATATKPLDHDLVSAALASFGETVVDELLETIEEQPAIEPVVSRALAQIGQPAVESLLAGMGSDSDLIRLAATRAIGGIRPLDDTLHARLAEAVADSSPEVRVVATSALIDAKPSSSSVRESLWRAMQDEEPAVRALAITALPHFEYSDEQIQGALRQGLEDDTSEVRSSTLVVLGQFPQYLRQSVDRVIELAADERAAIRAAAVRALGKLEESHRSEEVVQAIVSALSDEEPAVRIAATQTAQQLELADGQVLASISQNLADNLDVLRVSLEAITDFGERAEALIPPVANLLSHPQADVRVNAINALAAIEQNASQLADRLTGTLDDTEWEVRRRAGVALGKLGPDAKVAVPKLFVLLGSEEDSDFASSALREINAAPVEAVPLLIEQLGSEERRIGFYSVFLLGKIGPPAAEALPKLEAMLESPEEEGRRGGRSDFRRRFLREAIASIKGESAPEE